MAHLHGFIEFRQLGEWYGAIDVGVVLVPNSSLAASLCRLAEWLGMASVPVDASISFSERFNDVRDDVSDLVHLPYSEFARLASGQDRALSELAQETMFDVVADMATVLARRLGESEVRLLAYVD